MAIIKVIAALGTVAVTGTGAYMTYDYLSKKDTATTKAPAANSQKSENPTGQRTSDTPQPPVRSDSEA